MVSASDQTKLATIVFNEKTKLLAAWQANLSVAWYAGSGVTIPLALLAVMLSPDLKGWKAALVVLIALTLAGFFIWAGNKFFSDAQKTLNDLRNES